MQRYRSGHNEAVLKTVCPKGHVGSNPTLCVNETTILNWWFCYVNIFWRNTQEAEGAPLERE